MSPDTKTTKRTVALGEEKGSKLVELATGHNVSVADYFDREFGDLVEEKWRAMLEAKLQASRQQPASAGA